MTDAAFCFNDTNRERAIVKRSACKKKNGSKSKKCSLPSDKMTKKEIEKMSGPVQTWKMTEFYSWEEFKQMPKDIQAEYLNYIIDKYGVGIGTISAAVFEKSRTTLVKYIEKNGLKDKITKAGREGESGKRSAASFKAIVWAARHEPMSIQESEKLVEDKPEEVPISNKEIGRTEDDISIRCSMSFSTEYIAKEIDLSEIVEVEKMFKGRKVRVSFTIEAV